MIFKKKEIHERCQNILLTLKSIKNFPFTEFPKNDTNDIGIVLKILRV